MSEDVTFTVKLDPLLRDEFVAEAEAVQKPTDELVLEFMRNFVKARRHAREYDSWFRSAIEAGIREAEGPNTKSTPHEQVMAEWGREHAEPELAAGDVQQVSQPKPSAQELFERMVERRKGNMLPEGETIRDLLNYGRA